MNLEDSGEEVPIQLFEICLEREEFFPGEVVTGKLLVVTSRPLNTEGIFTKFEGRGAVRWKKSSAHLCGLHEAEFVQEKRKYFSNVFRCDMDSLPEGSSILTFEFELPIGIPQSIEPGTIMKQLKIFYSIEALIRTTKNDYCQQKMFTVKGIFNLNAYLELTLPTTKTIKEAIFESCWSSSGRILTLSFSIKKQGFVPGEQVKAELIIKDGFYNNVEIQPLVEVHLIQEIDLKLREASKVIRRIIATSDIVHVSNTSNVPTKGKKQSMKEDQQRKLTFSLKIPEDVLISYGNLEKQVHDFISIHYSLRMTMEQSSFPYKPFQIHLPIKIGTVWIKEQKVAPILLLAPVPLVLPRPKVPIIECPNKQALSFSNGKMSGKSKSADLRASATVNSMPEIIVTSKSSLPIVEQPASSNASPRTSKRRHCNAVRDSSTSLYKPLEAFVGGGGDSDSESFRSGVEDLQLQRNAHEYY